MIGFLRRQAFRRGIVGTSQAWLVVWVTISGFRLLRKLVGRTEKVVYSEELRPGQALVIAHGREPGTITTAP